MNKQKFGNTNSSISPIGLGLMGMSEFYGESNDEESIKTIHHALEKGINLLDTADMYGMGHNESLLNKAIHTWNGSRDELFICTKFGIQRNPNDPKARSISGKPDYVKQACEASLKRLGIDRIDLYYQHRVDPSVPIEDTVGAMKDLVNEGKVRYLGLSEASVNTIERAHKIHPITALQSEYSLWSRHLENEIIPLINKLEITLVAYSPLGRGFLTGKIESTDNLEETDFRRRNPRFQGSHLEKNKELLEKLYDMANSKGKTPAQIALAWIQNKNPRIFPIPGTRKITRLAENLGSTEINLDPSEMSLLNEWFQSDRISGDRYPEPVMKGLEL